MAIKILASGHAADFREELGAFCVAFAVENNGSTCVQVAFDTEGAAYVTLPPGSRRAFANIGNEPYEGRITARFLPPSQGVPATNSMTVIKCILNCQR